MNSPVLSWPPRPRCWWQRPMQLAVVALASLALGATVVRTIDARHPSGESARARAAISEPGLDDKSRREAITALLRDTRASVMMLREIAASGDALADQASAAIEVLSRDLTK